MEKYESTRYIVKAIKANKDCENPKVGKYKKTETEFTYMSKKDFKHLADKVKEDSKLDDEVLELEVIGSLKLKQVEQDDIDVHNEHSAEHYDSENLTDTSDEICYDTAIFEKAVKDSRNRNKVMKSIGLEARIFEKKKFFWYTKGYIWLGDNKYVAYCKNWLIILLIILGVLGVIGGTIGIITNLPEPPKYVETDPNYDEDQQDWSGSLPKSGKDSEASEDTITFPGYSTVVIDGFDGTVELVNPGTNTVDFTYTLLDGEGTELYTTSKIRPGKFVPFSIGKLFNAHGSYSCTFVVHTYDVNTGVECTSVTIPITLVINA